MQTLSLILLLTTAIILCFCDLTSASNSCNNTADLKTIANLGPETIKNKLTACTNSCFFSAKCIGPCFQKSTGLSEACADCYGNMAGCVAGHCALQCIDAESTACTNCRNQYCTPGFIDCAGIAP
eukprot:TRINITY_DN12803_c0_g1_i1.p1 TRINITY_DN12803_c0_g1~~TRINITY_DN12803_c0_g1_i1.p1  ORF type:complete len:125 (-),score=17.07 TRINITY_DN12803_c0_g1_i1:54-428(-)